MRWYQTSHFRHLVMVMLLILLTTAAAISWHYHRHGERLQHQIDRITEQYVPLFSQLQQLAQLQKQVAVQLLSPSTLAANQASQQQLQQLLQQYYQLTQQLDQQLTLGGPMRQLLFQQSQLLQLAEAELQSAQSQHNSQQTRDLLTANATALAQLSADFNGDFSSRIKQLQNAMAAKQYFSLLLAMAVAGIALVAAAMIYRINLGYQQRLKLLSFAEHNPLPLMRCNHYGQISYANPATKALIKQLPQVYRAEQLLPELAEQLQQMKQDGLTQAHWPVQIGDQHYDVQATLLFGNDQVQIHLFDDSEAHNAIQQLAHHSHFDELTGLANRQQFLQDCRYWSKQPGACFSFGSLNLLHFDRVASQINFQSADEIMQQLASRLSLTLAQLQLPHARLYRFEGAHYGVLLVHQNHPGKILKVAKHLSLAAERPLNTPDRLHSFHLSLNQGYACFPTQAKTIEELLSFADLAAQEAKRKEQPALLFEAQMHQRQQQFVLLESELRHAEQMGQLELHYQPQLQLDDQHVSGVEALLRWNHPQHGMISPAEFIPVAEQTGLIIPIGDWVLHTACAQAKQWQLQGISVLMSINLSAKQFRHPKFVSKVAAIIKQTGVDPQQIELELTESVLMSDINIAHQLLQQLKSLGVKLAIDDFGTGYSSLAYLKQFPVDTLKVDRCFITNLPADKQDSAIVKSILDLATHLKLRVIAEGVESDQQRQWLTHHCCDAIQGFWFSKPLPSEPCQQLLKQHQGEPQPTPA